MTTPRAIRRLAFQTLFQLDARGVGAAADIRAGMAGAEGFTDKERDAAFALAKEAYEGRRVADAFMLELAPTWPAHRQAAPDRAILRLAHHEMTTMKVPAAVVVNEAVELAKEFSTDKSPGFVNALLDKLLRRVGAVGAVGEVEGADDKKAAPGETKAPPPAAITPD